MKPNNLKQKRRALGISSAEIAERLGTDKHTYQLMEKSQRSVPSHFEAAASRLLHDSPPGDSSGVALQKLRLKLALSLGDAAALLHLTEDELFEMERPSAHPPKAVMAFLRNLLSNPSERKGRLKANEQEPSSLQQAKPGHLIFIRKQFNLSQDDLAHYVGVSRATVNRWETGKYPMPKHLMLTLRGVVALLKQEKIKQEAEE